MKYALMHNGELVHISDTLTQLKEKTAAVMLSERDNHVEAYICLLNTRNYFLSHSYARDEWTDIKIVQDVLYNYYGKALRYFSMDLLMIIN